MNQEQMELKTPEYVSLQFQLAGLGSRAAAFLIDLLILLAANILIIVAAMIIAIAMSHKSFFFSEKFWPVVIMLITLFVLNGGYFFAFEFFSGGRTFGKKLLGIRVIQENGHSITLLSSFIRNLIRIIDALPLCYLLGIIMLFFHPRHKRLGDLVAGTIVIHERRAKQKKKLTPMEKEIHNRDLSKDDLNLDDWTLKSFSEKDWELIRTYALRFHTVPKIERNDLTKQISVILLKKLGVEAEEKTDLELENILLVLYLNLKDEWEFEI